MKKYIFFLLVILLLLIFYLEKTRSCFDGFDLQRVKNINHTYSIIFSLTTSPKRINKMRDNLASLTLQTMKANYILLNLPKLYRNETPYVIPKEIKDNKSVVINRLENDYGPVTKLLGTILSTNKEDDLYIIIVDDDNLYLPQTVENYVQYINSNKKIAYSLGGFNVKNGKIDVDVQKKDLEKVSVFEGYLSCVFHRSMFDDDFLDYVKSVIKNDDCKFSDDVIVSNWINAKGIPIYRIYNKKFNRDLWWRLNCNDCGVENGDALRDLSQKSYENENDPLGGHSKRYEKVFEYLKENDLYYF